MNIGIIIAAVLISLAIGAIIGIAYRKKVAESKIHSAEEEAKKIVNMAKVEAENLKKTKIYLQEINGIDHIIIDYVAIILY